MPVRIPVTKVNRIIRVELIIALEGVLVLSIIGGLKGLEIIGAERVRSGPSGYRPGQREEIAEIGDSIDGEILNPKCLRNPQLVGGQISYPDVALCVRPLGIADDVIETRIVDVRLSIGRSRRKAG